MIETPYMLKHLAIDAVPSFGKMNAAQMLDHLRRGIELSLISEERVIRSAPEDLPKLLAFLNSDKDFKPGAKAPVEHEHIPPLAVDFMDAKVELMRSLVKMLAFFENNQHFESIHPIFGKLSTQQWLQLHYKHFRHHFKQFDLLVISEQLDS